MRTSTPTLDRACRVVVVLASLWFAFTAFWGLFAIPGGGHIGAGSAVNVMTSEQMLRWHSIYPYWEFYTGVPPTPAAAVCHHPYGQYWLGALSLAVFGHRDFVVHLAPALMSAAIVPLLYGIAREKWGAWAGAVAAASYAVVPIAVGFSQFLNLETFCIFGALLFFWGHSRHMTTNKNRYLVASLAGLGCAANGDWAGSLLVAPTLAWAGLRAFVLPARLTPRLRPLPYARWWALSVSLIVVTLAGTIALFYKADHLADWLSAADARGAGSDFKLSLVLQTRAHWIDFSFTPLAVTLGKVAAPVCVLRWILKRHDEETYAPGLLVGAIVQYVKFKQGADVHIFWPHYFAPYFALSLAQLVTTIAAAIRWGVRRVWPLRAERIAAVVGVVLGLAPAVAMAHDGVASLWVWRRTGGRYDDNGTLIRSHVDMLTVLQQVVLPSSPRDAVFDVHLGSAWGWEHQWKMQATAGIAFLPAPGNPAAAHPFWLSRGSGMSGAEQKKIAAMAHVRIYGDTWIVDQREAAAPLDAYSLNEREPNVFEWLLTNGTEPVRTVGASPDPWLTWEWRTHLGQQAAPPAGEPRTLDEMRIAHNVAVDRGDAAGADRWLQRIAGELDRGPEARFRGGVHLLGVHLIRGVQPRVEAWFQCSEPLSFEAAFNVRSTVEARARLSLIPPDPYDREMAYPPSIPTRLWRPGFVYKTEAVLNHRIGRERYWGYWAPRDVSSAPVRLDGAPQTTLVELP
jgi:4-amino-4-deoxy-L-arabinose transferase-like glycosyltransferase